MRPRQRRQTQQKHRLCQCSRRRQILRAAVLLCWLASIGCVHAGVVDPFTTLGVARTASPEEVKKQYRKLCLKYHPDKNVSKSEKERKLCEAKFKQVQEAFDMIENKKFGSSTFGTSGFRSQAGGTRQGYQTRGNSQEDLFAAMNDLFGSMDELHRNFSGKGVHFQFRRSGSYPRGTGFNSVNDESIYPANLPFKSIYVQSVTIPLQDLYKGKSSFQFDFKDSLVKRYRASFRGKMIIYSLCMALFGAISAVFTSRDRFFVAFVGLMMIHVSTPAPDPSELYKKPIQRGSKGGETSVKFSKHHYLEIIFKLKEAKHPVYRREGNNLHANLVITSREAARGCKKNIEALDPSEDPIEITIPPKTFRYTTLLEQRQQKKKNTLKISGRGWPIRKGDAPEESGNLKEDIEYDYGDLIVNIKVQKPTAKRKG